jgi:hypothetical protein
MTGEEVKRNERIANGLYINDMFNILSLQPLRELET